MKTRKLFSMLLAICLLLALLPTATLADEYESGWQYSVSDGKATIMHYNGAGGDVEIPATLGGCPVTGIGEQTFACCYALTSVTIPSCVESIGDDAFAFCYALTSVTIPSGVTGIGDGAFRFCYVLKDLRFLGSRAQFYAILKGEAWDFCMGENVGGYTIHFNAVPTEVSTWEDLQAALTAGGDIILTADVTPENPFWADALVVNSGVVAALDLNGHTVNRGYTEQGFDGSVIKIYGTLTVTDSDPAAGGAITGNKALGSSMGNSLGRGGGVYVAGGIFNFTGGEISGNDAGAIGGGVYLASTYSGHDGTINVSGNAAVTDNTVGTKNSNVYLEEGGVLSAAGALTGTIGVTMQTPGVFTSGWKDKMGETADPAEYFTSDNAGLVVSLTDAGEAKLGVEEYPLWVGGVQVDSANKDDILSDGGTASYAPDSNTLTLANANITGEYNGFTLNRTIRTEDMGLTVALTGSNTVSGRIALAVYGDLTITGGGSLTATGSASEIIYAKGNLAIDGCVINATAAENYAIFCRGDLTITDSNVTATSEAACAVSSSGGSLTISGGTVTATGKRASGTGHGIYAKTDIIISGGTVNASATGESGYGILSSEGNVNINSGNVIASGKTQAISGNVKNAVPGTGWSNVEGTEGQASIAIKSEGQNLGAYKKVQFPAVTYTVTVTPGANMTLTSGAAEQTVTAGGAMESVDYVANDGYYFPEDYAVASANGVAVTRDSFTQITVSGTPTGNASITLTAPTAQTREETPNVTFTATGYDTGTLTGLETGMRYSSTGGVWIDAAGESAELTGLFPDGSGNIAVVRSGNGSTTRDSSAQLIRVTRAEAPNLSVTQPTTIGGRGVVETTQAHEWSSNAYDWENCSVSQDWPQNCTVFIRVKATGTVLASAYQAVTINAFVPTQEPTPTATFTATGADTGTLSNVTAGMTYAIDGGAAVEITAATVELTGLAPCTITVIQPGNGTTTIDSDAQIITITKAETPSLTATQPSIIGGTGSIPTTAAHEFSEDGTAWTDCTGETTGLASGTYYVRVKAEGTVLASEAQEITITAFVPTQEPTPTAIFTATGADTGTLSNVTAGMTYAIDGGTAVEIAGTSVDLTGLAPCTITVIQPGNGMTTIDSEAQTITITKAETPDGITAENCSTSANNNGKLIGITSAMEYKKTDAPAWTAGTGDDVTGLVSGTYLVRVAASGTVLASDAQEITIAQYVAPPTDGWAPALVTEVPSGTTLTAAELNRLIHSGKTLTVIAENGAKAVFDTEALKGIVAQTTGSVKFVFEAQNVGEETTDYALTVTSADTELKYFGGTVTLILPYALDEGGNPNRINIWIIGKDGTREKSESTYDAEAHRITASVSGDSGRYVLGYVPFPYRDVPRESYYYDAVDWADLLGITMGTAPDLFSPNGSCTRAQMVTFLWRVAGRPEPTATDHPFNDLDESAYYYKAVLWAAEKGITLGIGDGMFDPDGKVTRAQMVTFLWRTAGKPESATTEKPFSDLDEEAYYYEAVLWAFENGITLGTGDGKFSPNGDCLRAQIVTFLYRTYSE